jgi:hypothetical protein
MPSHPDIPSDVDVDSAGELDVEEIASFAPQAEWQRAGDADDDYHVPVRPRRRFLNGTTAALIAIITAAAGFYGGVRVEKGQLSAGSGASGRLGGFGGGGAGRFAALASRFAAAAGGSSAAGAAGSSASGSGAGAFASRFVGVGGGATFGTVSSVDRSTLYVTSTDGNTVKVQLSSATKLTKTEDVGKARLHPGDTVIVAGLTKSGGTIVATSVSDTGASAGASPGGSSGGGGSSGNGGGVSSLFQAGGGG